MNHSKSKSSKNKRASVQKRCNDEIFSFFEDQNGSGQGMDMDEEEDEEEGGNAEEVSQFYSGDHLFGVLVEMFPQKTRQSLLQAWNTHRPNLEAAVCQLLSQPEYLVGVSQPISTGISSENYHHNNQNDCFDDWSGLTPPEKYFRDDWSNSWDATTNNLSNANIQWNVDLIRNSKLTFGQQLEDGHQQQSTYPS